MRDSIIFYSSFYEAIQEIDNLEDRAKAYDSIFAYALEGKEIKVSGMSKIIFKMAKPQIDANNKRYEDGKKGGAPKGNQNARKQPKNNQKQPVVDLENNQKQPNVNVNVNNNVNKNVNENNNVNVVVGNDQQATTSTSFNSYDKSFQSFWGMYGKKAYKDDVYEYWLSQEYDDDTVHEIVIGAENYSKSFDDKTYMVFPRTFLSNEMWKDFQESRELDVTFTNREQTIGLDAELEEKLRRFE